MAGDIHSNGQSSFSQTDRGRNSGKTGLAWTGVKENERTDSVADDLRLFGIGDGEGWKTAGLEPGKWWEMVMEGRRKFMGTWKKEERAA